MRALLVDAKKAWELEKKALQYQNVLETKLIGQIIEWALRELDLWEEADHDR